MTTTPRMSRYQELLHRAQQSGEELYPPSPVPARKEPATAYVTDVHIHKRSGIRTVEIKCPHCPMTHTHGWPLSDREGAPIGHRTAHCADGNQNSGYFIVIREEAPC